MTRYKIEELAREAEISPRTVRYYVQRGLLPAPEFRGKDSGYGREHLVRLRAIRRLQEAFYPLDAIIAELEGRELTVIERIADGKDYTSNLGGDLPIAPVRTLRWEKGARDDAHRRGPTKKGADHAAGAASVGRDDDEDSWNARAESMKRLLLAPGLELTLHDDAPDESRRLVAEILAAVERQSSMKGGR